MEALPRQGLHAEVLGFVHPSTGKYMEFSSPLPEDFSSAIDMWEEYSRKSMDARARK